MPEFNLIEEPWIPCSDRHGQRVEYGIRDTLFKARDLGEVCDDSPLVTVATHRLLLAILYRAFQGPRDFPGWKRVFERGSFDVNAVAKYLDTWRERFNLFDQDRPFYQMGRLRTERRISTSRLASESASGNNATLFDHSGDEVPVEWTPAQAAKRLVACQSFALGFGKSGKAEVSGVEEALPYLADAIALRGMSTWLQGTSLFDTLSVNLVPVQDNSLPPWELEDSQAYRDRLDGGRRMAVRSMGVVDRLTWQSRLVRLVPESGTVPEMYYAQGRSADKSPGDPMKAYRTSKKEGISALSLSGEKAAWRDAHSILTIPAAESNERRPECFNLVARARSTGVLQPGSQFDTHVVGLASAPNKPGKFLLWRHERMPIPVALLGNVNLIERLSGLLQSAKQAAIELRNRTRRIAKLFLSPTCESRDGRRPDKHEVTKMVEAIDPRPAYWARLEQHFFDLLENLANDWDEPKSQWKPDDQQSATRTWCDHVKREARQALEESIRSLGTTARAIQAVARVRTDFGDDDLKPPQQKAAKAKGRRRGGTERK